jgi:hypothetical protein
MPFVARSRKSVIGALVVAVSALAVSCSDGDDPIGRACDVVVHRCHALSTSSECIDLMVEWPDCASCIAEQTDCGYATCDRVPGCRIPDALLPHVKS